MLSPSSLVVPLDAARATTEELLGLLLGYVNLLTACYEARERGLAPMDAPVECHALHQVGVGADLLLWMLYQGHVHHLEGGAAEAGPVEWSIRTSAVVGERSAFALTPMGERFGELLMGSLLLPEDDEQVEWAW